MFKKWAIIKEVTYFPGDAFASLGEGPITRKMVLDLFDNRETGAAEFIKRYRQQGVKKFYNDDRLYSSIANSAEETGGVFKEKVEKYRLEEVIAHEFSNGDKAIFREFYPMIKEDP